MRPVALIENDPLLPGAGLLERTLDARGIPWILVRGHAGEARGLAATAFSGVVVLGGRPHAWEEDVYPFLRDERELLAACVWHDVPALGCCLGGQVLARALGAGVRPASAGEHGWVAIEPLPAAAADPLFLTTGPASDVYLWHVDEFDLPDGAVHLASSSVSAIQGFRVGRAWGLQFHPEVDAATLRTWFRNFPDAARHAGVDEAAIHAQAERHEVMPALPRRLLDGFADVVLGLA